MHAKLCLLLHYTEIPLLLADCLIHCWNTTPQIAEDCLSLAASLPFLTREKIGLSPRGVGGGGLFDSCPRLSQARTIRPFVGPQLKWPFLSLSATVYPSYRPRLAASLPFLSYAGKDRTVWFSAVLRIDQSHLSTAMGPHDATGRFSVLGVAPPRGSSYLLILYALLACLFLTFNLLIKKPT